MDLLHWWICISNVKLFGNIPTRISVFFNLINEYIIHKMPNCKKLIYKLLNSASYSFLKYNFEKPFKNLPTLSSINKYIEIKYVLNSMKSYLNILCKLILFVQLQSNPNRLLKISGAPKAKDTSLNDNNNLVHK